MRNIRKGFLAAIILSSGFLTGCASLGGGCSSGDCELAQKEIVGGGSISKYQPVAYSKEKAAKPKSASHCSS